MKKLRSSIILVLFLQLLFASKAQSLVTDIKSIDDLGKYADLVLEGDVSLIETGIDEDGDGRIYTYITLDNLYAH